MSTAYNVLQKIQQAYNVDRQLLVPDGSSVIPVNPTGLGVCVIDTDGTYTLENDLVVPEGTRALVLNSATTVTVEGVTVADGGVEEFILSHNSSGTRVWFHVNARLLTAETNIADLESKFEGAKVVDIPLTQFQVHDSNANLPAAATSDDLGITPAVPATSNAVMHATLSDATGTQEAIGLVAIPQDYVAGNAISIVIPWTRADAATDSMTLDLVVNRVDDATTDLNTTDPEDVNTAASGTATFVLTPTNLSPGDMLAINILVAIDDTTTGTGDGAILNWEKISFSYTT